ncbi:MAG: NHLP bacteriocin system secretion protein [Burkholderiales bacterium RIFOXYD12_FULL_59_19]|nr:MAG: NHLP bacteriocin system secretion protein [Burkholderiales bacterium RIFOXYD12_FULL_59_19]
MSGRSLFRQAALERMSSPEQLDRLLTITDTRGWLALLASGGLILYFLAWSVFGALPTHVTGAGILMPRAGVVGDASSQATGTLLRFAVGLNEPVKKGQAVAYIEQPINARRSDDAALAVRDQASALARIDADYQREINVKTRAAEKRKLALRQSIEEDEARLAFLTDTLARQESVQALGFFSKRALSDARADISRVRLNVANSRNELNLLDAELLQTRNLYQLEREKLALALNDARRAAGQLAQALARDSVITAPIDGRVIELKLAPGAILQAGQAVLSIESGHGTANGLEALVYIPTEHGKKLTVGQAVRLAPANVKKEEYGTLLGRVQRVSEFPVTQQGMQSVLPNAALASLFAKDGPPYAVTVDLEPDATLQSGYRWTSAQGAPFPVQSGTTLSAEITVIEQAPISLLIPFLRKTTGIY